MEENFKKTNTNNIVKRLKNIQDDVIHIGNTKRHNLSHFPKLVSLSLSHCHSQISKYES